MPDGQLGAQSGNDVLGYTGNANLSGGGITTAFNPAVSNPLENVQSTLSRMQGEGEYYRQQQYQQKIKNREQLAATLAQTGDSLFNMKGENGRDVGFTPLPEDAAVIQQKADELRKFAIGNPSKYRFDPEYYKKKDELTQLTRNAGLRSAYSTQARMQMAQSNDPEERQAISDKLQQEVGGYSVNDAHSLEPYMPKPKADLTEFVDPKLLSDKDNYDVFGKQMVNENGIAYEVGNNGLKSNFYDVSGITPSSKMYPKARLLASAYLQGEGQNPAAVQQLNNNIDKINTARGLNPGDQGFQPHLAEVVQGSDGKPQIQYTTNDPVKILQGLMTEHYGQTTQHKTASDAALKQKQEALNIQKTKKEMANEDEKLKIDREKLELDKNKMDKADYESQKDELDAKETANKVYGHMINTKNFMSPFSLIQSLPTGNRKVLANAINNSGIDVANYDVAKLNPGDQSVQSIAGIQLQKPDGTLGAGVAKPEAAYLFKSKDGNPANNVYLVGYNFTTRVTDKNGNFVNDKNGKPQYKTELQWKSVSPQEGIGNVVKSDKGFYNLSDKTGQSIDKANSKLTELMSGKSPVASKQETPSYSFAGKPIALSDLRKTANGTELNVNGQWKKVIGRTKSGELKTE